MYIMFTAIYKANQRNCILVFLRNWSTGKKLLISDRQVFSKEFEEVRIPVPWGHIAGKWWGVKETQPILAIHGWEDNAGSFDTIIPMLNVNSVLAIDLPGHGNSSHFPKGRMFYFNDALVTIRRVVKYFNWKRISILGHSFGSCAGYVYSATYPDDVKIFISLDCARTLMAPSPEEEIDTFRKADKIISLEEKLGATIPQYSYDKIITLLYDGSHKSLTLDSCKILLQRGMSKSLGSDKKFYFSRDPRLRYHSWYRYTFTYILNFAPFIKCDVLSIRAKQGFIFGGEREKIYLKSVEMMKTSANRLEHHEVEGTHHVHLNNPNRVAPIINKFIEGT